MPFGYAKRGNDEDEFREVNFDLSRTGHVAPSAGFKPSNPDRSFAKSVRLGDNRVLYIFYS